VSRHLRDAARLVEASFVQRKAGDPRWVSAMRRSAELLEWLSLPELNRTNLPLRFLAAAAYQVAGYPARASSLLEFSVDEGSEVLRCFLQANFPALLVP